MSRRKTDPGAPTESNNVVVLQPPLGGGGGKHGGAKETQGTRAFDEIAAQSHAMTHDGLDLLRAFLAIEDATARASLVILAQRLASASPKR
jgi:hypothetical protein